MLRFSHSVLHCISETFLYILDYFQKAYLTKSIHISAKWQHEIGNNTSAFKFHHWQSKSVSVLKIPYFFDLLGMHKSVKIILELMNIAGFHQMHHQVFLPGNLNRCAQRRMSQCYFQRPNSFTMLLRPHSFWDFSGRRVAGISVPNSTYSSWNGIILFRNKNPKFIQIYHHYSSYSCSFSYFTLWGGIDGTDGILFQFYLFPKIVPFHLLFRYSTSSYSQKVSKGMQS